MTVFTLDFVVPGVDFMGIVDGLYGGIALVHPNLHHPAIGEISRTQHEYNNRNKDEKLILSKGLPKRQPFLGLFPLQHNPVGFSNAPEGPVDQDEHHYQKGKNQTEGPEDQLV